MQTVEPIRGVIFDLDGVLIHSAPAHRQAFVETLIPFEINDFNYGKYAGWRTRDVIADVFRRHDREASAAEIDEVSLRKSRRAQEILQDEFPVDPNCGFILAELAARYPLALASSGSRNSVAAFLNSTGSRSLFRSVLCSEDVRNSKPDPEIYARSAEALGLKPEQCLVVEDAVAGVCAATAIGAPVVGIAGTVSVEELQRAGAARIISNLGDLRHSLETSAPVKRSSWTAVIPAAGRGSRLGFHRPKILYPVANRMILEWMLDFLEPGHERLVFVLSPDGAADVRSELEKLLPGRYEIVIQEIPTGMGAAVSLALPHVSTPNLSIVWGDQVALRKSSVETCQRLHQGPLEPDLTCPTVLRDLPYIHFDRGAAGNISGLRQARERDTMPPRGESDTGFFCFKTPALKKALPEVQATSGSATGEFNLLPVIPAMVQSGKVLTPRVMCLEETVGINSIPDAGTVASFLQRTDEHKN